MADQRADTPRTSRYSGTAPLAVVDMMLDHWGVSKAKREGVMHDLQEDYEAAADSANASKKPAAAEPPAPTGDNDADTCALIEAWGEPEVQAEGMSVKQWERHVADLRERAAQPPRGSHDGG